MQNVCQSIQLNAHLSSHPYNAELILYKIWRPKGLFQFEIIINGLGSFF